ncbi:sodium ion-translocating decarboxylase subunit beta [Jeotgalibaca ciconiae]|uniref:Sodium ion-translocating decarboxylase subunit beta n=1 Tax=Jeotgalibaca ciconiae TaxID=2496265 RepID=A0A3S9H9S5_9LACT|nr:sodium ion-translocating decarboxylase subunit beta [Jeotgalibaca ciconiae]AZP03953.1 sodium ion-translocating decarboxylase subunit beta [Jeotgalibaca ciconiae]HJB23982.1 sodium ion-translocating decarboxylase subunit beta [Candidatus Jeotgalibaca pullicola]
MLKALIDLWNTSGLANMTYKEVTMIAIACIFLYLAIKKGYEPYLLIPIAFGILLVNLPLTGLMYPPENGEPGGLLYYLFQGTDLGIYPPLIFLCLGASTDFGPLLANPKTLLLGGAAQFGIFAAFFGALALNMTPEESSALGIIGGADGPTAIYLTAKLASHLLPTIALAAYSYMALVPIIQPPIMRLLTTEEERKTEMKQLRHVSKTEKILFPIITTIFISLIVPSATALIGMLMLGNLIRESGQVPKLTETLQNAMMYIITIILGITVGAKATGELFLSLTTLKIVALGLFAFAIGTASGVLMGKVMYKLSGGKINPLIGAAGVSAVPMAARVVQKEGIKYNPSNYLLMHAMGPNVAGVIGSAVAAGVLLSFFG